ncbi:hypothetical protein D3C80_1499960 [compost metagenome]
MKDADAKLFLIEFVQFAPLLNRLVANVGAPDLDVYNLVSGSTLVLISALVLVLALIISGRISGIVVTATSGYSGNGQGTGCQH